MKEILTDIDQWFTRGETAVALATVIATWGSSPRRVGAKMAVTADGRISGSVSGGCVEGSVVEAGISTLESGKPQLLHYGVADETAWSVGLACGGSIDIFVEVLEEKWYQLYKTAVESNWSGAIVTVVQGSQEMLGDKRVIGLEGELANSFNHDLDFELQDILPSIRKSQTFTVGSGLEIFIDLFQPSPILVMVGGVHVAIALAREAKGAGYQTIVIDPRRSFGNELRFPNVDLLIQKWPKRAFQDAPPAPEMAVALLTHDPKIDDQALDILLRSDVFYLGALGSRKTHAKRKDRLREKGFSDEEVARIFAPIGLNIGAQNPEEIALAIMAEIVGVRRGVIIH